MFSEINQHSIAEALNYLHIILKNCTPGESDIEIYVKLSSEFDDKLNETSFSCFLPPETSVVIIFEFNMMDTKIFWRKSGKKVYCLTFHGDKSGAVSQFCGQFIANELKLKNDGILTGWNDNLYVDVRNIGNQQHQNLIIKAVMDCQPEIVKLLVKQAIDIDHEDNKQLSAIDHAWKSYMNTMQDKERQIKYNSIILTLLNANSRYPTDKSCLKMKNFSIEIKKFVDEHQQLHDHLENLEYDFIKTKLAGMSGNLCHFYDIYNISLMNHAVQNYNKEVYDLLSSHGISLGSHEDPDMVFEQFKIEGKLEKEAIKIKSTNQNNALMLSNMHIEIIMTKLKVINNCGDQHRHRTKAIKDALTHMDSDENCSKVLKVVAACKNLNIFADFMHETANFIDPVNSKNTLGLTTTTGVIRIGAKNLLDESTKSKFIGVFIHEFCHLAILMTFLNNFKPYSIGDENSKMIYEEAVEECQLNKDREPLIEGVFEYEEKHQHGEFIVRVVQMIMEYYGVYESDGTSKIENCRRIFPKLFTYFDDIVAPALDEVLDILKILQNSELDVSYEDLTQHQKNRIKHKTNNFQGTDTTLFNILGEDEVIYNHLTGKEIRYFLFTEKTCIFKSVAINENSSDIGRRFIRDNEDVKTQGKGFTLVKDELERHGIFLLIDNAGAGKTEAFIDLSKKLKLEYKNHLIHCVDMSNQHIKDVFNRFMDKVNRQEEKLNDKTISNLMLETMKLKSKFEKQINETLFIKNKVIFLFDGIDKINSDLLEFLQQIIFLLMTKLPHKEDKSMYVTKLLISSCQTTLIKSNKIYPTICDKSYKLAHYRPEERISYIFEAIPGEDKSKRLEKMVWFIWLFDLVEYDQGHKFTNLSLIKKLMEHHKNPKINSHQEIQNFFLIADNLYKLNNLDIKFNPKRSFTLLKILQAYALPSIAGRDINFLLIKSWNKEKRLWKSHEFERSGLLYADINDPQNVSKFIHKTCPEYFATTYLIKLLFGEDDTIKEIEFKNAVDCLRIIGKSPRKHQIIHKLLLHYIKNDRDLSFFDEVKAQLFVSIQDIRQDIINSNELVDSLKFWSILLSRDQKILKLLWQPETQDNLLKTVIVIGHQKSVNFIKILKIISISFGSNWKKNFLINNLNSQNPANGLIADDCKEFNRNLNFFIEFIAVKLNNEQIHSTFDKILTKKAVVRHTNLSNIQTCLNKCRNIFKNDEGFFIHIFKRFLYNTKNPTVLQYFGEQFEKLLKNNEESIKDVLFSTSCGTPLILISLSHCRRIFNAFKNLFIKYDNPGTQVYDYLNENNNILKVFLSMNENNFMDAKEFLKGIYSSKFHKLIDCIENVDDELKNNLICDRKKLKNFSRFMCEISFNNQAYPYICENLYCGKRFSIKDNNLNSSNQHLESITMLYVVYGDLMDKLLNYFDHKCEFSPEFKYELHDFPENFKVWFEQNELLKNSPNFDLFLKFGLKFYLKNKKEFDEIVLKAFKVDKKKYEKALNDINERNSSKNKKILGICKTINRKLNQFNLFNENNFVPFNDLFV